MDWLATELLTGFQKLLCLGLERTPATDLIGGTVMAWREALTAGRVWDADRDRDRIRRAFVTLALTRESWPAPKHFLDALPPAPKPLALVREVRVDPEVLRQNVARLKAKLAEAVQ